MVSSVRVYCQSACKVMRHAIRSTDPEEGKKLLATLVPMHCKECEGIKRRVELISAEMRSIREKRGAPVEESPAGLVSSVQESISALSRLETLVKEHEALVKDGKALDEMREVIGKVEQFVQCCGLAPRVPKISAIFKLIITELKNSSRQMLRDVTAHWDVVSNINLKLGIFLEDGLNSTLKDIAVIFGGLPPADAAAESEQAAGAQRRPAGAEQAAAAQRKFAEFDAAVLRDLQDPNRPDFSFT